MKNRYTFSILFMMILSFLVHIYQLHSTPPLDIDEFSISFNALSIATNGHDEWGKFMPLFFRSFGDYKLPLDIYLSAIFFKLFSPSVFWLRLPSVLFAILYIPLVYHLIKSLIENKKYALLGAGLISFLPYNLFYSHLISASISASFLIFASLTSFIQVLKNNNVTRNIILSIIFLSLSLYAYPLSWIISPLLIISYSIALFFSKKLTLSKYFIIFFACCIPILSQFFIGGSAQRLSNTSAFSFNRGEFMEIMEFRETGKNDFVSRIFHNKATTAAYVFSTNYLKHFNISYLAFDKTEPAIQIAPYPPLFIILLPFYILGLFFVAKKFRNPIYFVLLSLVLIAPLPSAITEGAVHPKRYLAFMGTETVLIVLAINQLKLSKHRLLLLLFSGLLLLEIGFSFRYFFSTYRQKSNDLLFWKGHMIAGVAQKYWPNRKLIYTSEHIGEPQIYPLVGASYSPSKYIQKRSFEYKDNWYYIKPFDGLYYAKSMEDIVNHISQDSAFSSIGIFSAEEITILPPTICYAILNNIYSPLSTFHYFIIDIKPCSS